MENLLKLKYSMPSKLNCLTRGFCDFSIVKIANLIKNDLKNEFGDKIKFSVRTQNNLYNRAIIVTILEVSEDLTLSREQLEEDISSPAVSLDMELHQNYLQYSWISNQKYRLKHGLFDYIVNLTNSYNYVELLGDSDVIDCNYLSFVNIKSTGFKIIKQ